MTPEMIPVQSSNIEAVGYDPTSASLHVKFKTSPAPYIHSDVSPEEHAAFMAAESAGSHYHKNFKHRPHTRPEASQD